MIKLGLTGGIGSGKSLIAQIFSCLGVPVFNADMEARKLLTTNQQMIIAIQEKFGTDIYIEGRLDRKKISEIVFNDKSSLQSLNNIVHPEVQLVFEKWLKLYSNHSYVVKEAAILFESGAYKTMDKILTVYAPEKLRIQRVMKRDRVEELQVKSRIFHQFSEEEKMKRANYVIYNDDEHLVIPQVLHIHSQYSI